MRENDGRKLDHKTLEALRLRAVEQVRQGARPEDVSVALGLHRKTVYAWLKKYREGGRSALLARPVPGRPPRLRAQQVHALSALLSEADPRNFDLELALWTAEIVREVIVREFGVTLSQASVNRQLDAMGMRPRRPLRRAYQQDPEATSLWHRREYPRIAARAAIASATIYFADTGRLAGPCAGQLTMISAITAKGCGSRFAVFDASVARTASFTEFCARLTHDAPGLVFLVVDRHPAHRSQAVMDYAASTDGKLELFYLPTAT